MSRGIGFANELVELCLREQCVLRCKRGYNFLERFAFNQPNFE